MNFASLLKKALPVMVFFAVTLGVLNMGSYDPYNELTVLAPASVQATSSFSNASGLNTPSLSNPTLSQPEDFGTGTTVETSSSNGNSTTASTETSTLRTCNVTANEPSVYTGSSVTVSWTTQGFSSATLNGVAVDVSSGSKTFTNVQTNTTYTLVAKTADGKSDCTTSITVLCLPPVVLVPACDAFTATPSTITKGNSAQLNWSTTNASSVFIDNSIGNVSADGSLSVTPATTTTYLLTAYGTNNQKHTCTTKITVSVPPVVTPYCELTLNKSVSSTSAKPGDELTYTIKIKNTGTANCTGGGVKIMDIHDANISYLSETHTSNLTAGYGSNPIYVSGTKTLYWNGNTLTPGEEGTIVWKGKVNENLACGVTTIVKNTAKATAYELSNFTTWAYSNTVETSVYKACDVPVPTCDSLTATPSTITRGNSALLNWSTTNTDRVSINNGIGDVSADGSLAVTPATTTTYMVTAYRASVSDTCTVKITVQEPPVVVVPRCDAFTATPSTITKGNSAQLNWVTSNTNRVTINNGIGDVSATGTVSVTPLATTDYLLTAYGVNDQKHTCTVKLTVEEPPVVTVPKCETFTATPTSLPVGGGSVVLNWTTTNTSGVSISPTIGSVAVNGSTTVTLSTSTTFTLTARDAKGSTNTCTVAIPVTPPTPTPITCEKNVSLKADASTISRGDSSTLSWTTTNITGVTFDNGITATGLSGSTSVSPSNTTTYTLTATDGKDTIKCPVTVTVRTSGGGGGGSSSPRCELSASDNKINSGEKVVLKWESSRATDISLEDRTTDEIIVTTDKLSSKAKDRLLDGSVTVSPKKDTTYLLTVKRGSSKRTCSVKVEVENNVVVTQVRDQQPLVAGISLSQVPYTGFEAGPILTLLFYTLLMAWALYVAYLIVIRKDSMGGVQFATVTTNKPAPKDYIAKSEAVRPDVFVAKVQAPVMPVSTLTPNNLPTGAPVIGYGNAEKVVSSNIHHIDDAEMTKIENFAHAQRVLLSSDAIRHFIATTNDQKERTEALNQVLQAAKSQFPSEDGWVVLNEKRMKDICLVCSVNSVHSNVAPYIPAVIPEGAGSLAETIVTGNVVAAYEMIGNRPMFALADAAADLDAIYRIRKGGKASVSELLLKETANLSNEQIVEIISALTGALDGTYTDEASAVKMAIMKAIKVVA